MKYKKCIINQVYNGKKINGTTGMFFSHVAVHVTDDKEKKYYFLNNNKLET